MSDEKIAGIMRDAAKALEKKDVEKVLSLFVEDGSWVAPEGTFKGKAELKRYLTWMFNSAQGLRITESGNGIVVQGNKAFFEHVLTYTWKGRKVESLVLCAWEFSDDKIKQLRTVEDRLSIAKQAVSGWPGTWIVNSIVKQAESGLR